MRVPPSIDSASVAALSPATEGWRVAADFSDNDTSAAGKVTRPGFLAMLETARTGGVSVVLAYDMTGLTRNARALRPIWS